MKRNIITTIIIVLTTIGVLSLTSCKRGATADPTFGGPAGFRISLSGTANPSTLYLPENLSQVGTVVTARVLNNDGTPVIGFDVIFREGGYGYFDGFKVSDTRVTDSTGMARINYYVPAAANVKAAMMTNITATLVDDGRLDLGGSVVEDYIPIRIIPYLTQGIVIHGHILTPAGSGVSDVTVTLAGADGNISAVTVTRASGSYEFFVPAGWYGTITPTASGYSMTPAFYLFESTNPIISDQELDFVAVFAGGNNLVADITSWEVPVEGGTNVVNISNGTGDSSIPYTATPSTPWIHVSPTSGATPGSFTVTVDENTTGSTRSGQIVVAATGVSSSNTTINISQLANEVPTGSTLAADITTINSEAVGGSVTVNVYNSTRSESINYNITVDSPIVDWVAVSKTTGSTNDSFIITVSANSESARSHTITLTPTSTGVNNQVVITINQDAAGTVAVSPTTFAAPSTAGTTFTVTVTNPTTTELLSWTATNTDGWITATPTTGFTNGGTFLVTIQTANPTSNIRQGIITVTASNGTTATVLITQAGS